MNMKKLNKILNPTQQIVFYGIKYFPSKGGTSRVAENLIKNLVNDYKILIYCFKNPKAKNHIKGVETKEFIKLPFKEIGVFFYFLFSALHILLFIDKRSIIHAHKTDCALFIPLLRLKFKVILTSHEAPYHRDKWTKIGKWYFKWMEIIYIRSGALLTSISEPLAEYYRQKYKKDVVFIPNGIDLENKIDSQKAAKILKEHNVSGDFILFAARRIMSTKGCHTMLEALSQINYKLPILIAGDLTHAKQYVKELKDNYKHLDVKYIGYIDNLEVLTGLIKKSSLFIFPSEIEGMSIMLLEVAITGVPLISSDIPENKAVFLENEMLFFMNKNAEDLAQKINWAQNNPDKMQELSVNAQNLIRQKYSWKNIVLEYKVLYESINEKKRTLNKYKPIIDEAI